VSHHRLRAAATPAATVDFLQYATDSVDRTTYTFSAQAIGAVGDRRGVAVAVHNNNLSGIRTVSSITVDGVSLSLLVADSETAGVDRLEIWAGAVNTANTTGDIVVTFSGNTLRCIVGVFELHNVASYTPTATDTEETDNTAMTATVSAGGIAIAAAGVRETATTFSWTGDLADHGDSSVEIITTSVASAEYAAGATATATADAAANTQYTAVMATLR